MQSYADAPAVYTAADIQGGSVICKTAREHVDSKQCVPGEKQYTELKLNGKEWVRVVSPRNIKKQLLANLTQSFQFDTEVIQQIGQVKIWQLPEVQNSLQQARKTCAAAAKDGSLSQGFERLIEESKSDNVIRQQLAQQSEGEKEALAGRYLLARLELMRITRSINSKYVRGTELERLKIKREKLQLTYPLAQQVTPWHIQDLLQSQEGLSSSSNVVISKDEEELVDQILGLSEGDTSVLSEKLKNSRNLNLSTQVAQKVLRQHSFSKELKTEMIKDWERTFAEKIAALGNLCDAPTCQAYEVSHQSTAELVNSTPDGERTNLLGDICNCNLSNETKWVPSGVRYATIGLVGTGLVACLASNVFCPALATIGLAGSLITATDAVSNWKDMARGQETLDLARNLDGLDPTGKERKRLEKFSGRAARQGLTATALTAGLGAQNLKTALSPIQTTKDVMKMNALAGRSEEWLKEFLAKSPQYKKLPPKELERIAKEVVGSERKLGFVAEVFKSKNVTVKSYINQDGEEVFKFTAPAIFRSRTGELVERDLVRDAKTGAFDANFPEGRQLIEAMVESSEKGVIVIFEDLNYLGATNYYRLGQSAGDLYLQAFGSASRQNLRPSDLTFKTGGDELVTIVPITDEVMAQPEAVKTLVQRMIDSVQNSRQARDVFKEQSRALSEDYKSVGLAKSFEALPQGLVTRLSSEQVQQATADFAAFQKTYLANQLEILKIHAKFQPSISIGATIVPKGGGSYSQAKILAEQQAVQVKVVYKGEVGTGSNLSKYGVQGPSNAAAPEGYRRVEDIRPRALDPVVLPPPAASQ